MFSVLPDGLRAHINCKTRLLRFHKSLPYSSHLSLTAMLHKATVMPSWGHAHPEQMQRFHLGQLR